LVDAIHDGVQDREVVIQETGAEGERSLARIARRMPISTSEGELARAGTFIGRADRPSLWGRRDRSRPRRC
jgi:hypothetical protein